MLLGNSQIGRRDNKQCLARGKIENDGGKAILHLGPCHGLVLLFLGNPSEKAQPIVFEEGIPGPTRPVVRPGLRNGFPLLLLVH